MTTATPAQRLAGLVVLAVLAGVVVIVDGSTQAIPIVFGSLLLLLAWLSSGGTGTGASPAA